jgi:dynein heavy chain
MNLPQVEEYGTQTPMSLLRQHIDQGSWYDRSDMSLKKNIISTQYVSCMDLKNGSGYICPRLQRHFITFTTQLPSESDLHTIFGTILHSHLYNFDNEISQMTKSLTDASIALHKEISLRYFICIIFIYTMYMLTYVSICK